MINTLLSILLSFQYLFVIIALLLGVFETKKSFLLSLIPFYLYIINIIRFLYRVYADYKGLE